jgi:hypothetical protein
MARTGLRMMPTFPSPPLKFRTAGFPRYGFKASLSDPAFPVRREVKPAPGMPSDPGGFAMVLRACAGYTTLGAPVPSPTGQSGVVFAHGHATDPRGPWLRSEFCCLRSSSLTPTPSASLAGTARLHRFAAYTRGLRCAGAPRRPARPSLLSLSRCPHVPPTLPRWVRWPVPLVLGSAIPGSLELRASRHPHPRLCQPSPTGVPFEAASFASCCGPCVCPALLAGYNAVQERPTPRLLRYRVTPALGTGRHRAVLGVRLDGRTGNLPSSGLSPDKSRQVVRLHRNGGRSFKRNFLHRLDAAK